MSSIGSIKITRGFSAYESTKVAIDRITDFIHVEYPNVKAFAYHTGSVKTELTKTVPENIWNRLIDTPELAAGYCVWLTAEEADFLRGRFSMCNWDVDEWMKNAKLIVDMDLLKEEVKMS